MISSLSLTTELRFGSTDISDVYFTPPYKITSPFKDGSHSDIMIMSASAGILGGDVHTAQFSFGKDTDTSIISQSYEKVMDTRGNPAKRFTTINIAENATLRYLPYPVIPFENSEYYASTDIFASSSSSFIYTDIFSCGRVGMGEQFLLKSFTGKTNIHIDNKLTFADNTIIIPEEFDYKTLTQWQKYTHNGLLYFYVPDAEILAEILVKIREIKGDFLLGASLGLKGLSVRVLASSGEKIHQLFAKIGTFL